MHNLPPNLSYVSTLPESTQKPKRDTDELNHGLTDTWDHIPHDINNNSNNNIEISIPPWVVTSDVNPLTSGKHSRVHVYCVKAKQQHFKHLL